MIYEKPYERTYESIFDFVKDSIYLSNLPKDKKISLLNQIKTDLSVEQVHKNKEELLGHYSDRCNTFLLTNEIVVDFENIAKDMKDNKKSYIDILLMKKNELGHSGGRHHEMNLKDIKEVCKANQIKLSRVVDGKRVAYKKKELMTKLKRKKLL